MPTQPRTSAEHYQAAERLISATEETPASAPLLALAHAILTLSPRKARRVERLGRHVQGGSPQTRWMLGLDGHQDDKGDES